MFREKITYLDNGATSFPKPEGVLEAYINFSKNIGASPARGGYATAIEAGRLIFKTRLTLAKILGVEDPARIILTKSATEALNLIFFGYLKPGDKVVSTRMEHNAVIRPLRYLQKKGIIEVLWTRITEDGRLDLDNFIKLAQTSGVKMVVTTGIANSTGVILPVREIGKFCRDRGIVYVVDGAQMAGVYPVNVERDNIDVFVFTGHKGLYGVQGTGGFFFAEHVQIQPLILGGTGTRSELDVMPEEIPARFEAGTPNTPGIVALGVGVEWVLGKGIENIHKHKQEILKVMHEKLVDIEGVRTFGPQDIRDRTAIVPIILDCLSPQQTAYKLWQDFKIAVRAGLHCAPHIHGDLGAEKGTVRFSFGINNTIDDALCAVEAIKSIASECKNK